MINNDSITNTKEFKILRQMRKRLYFVWLLFGWAGGHYFMVSQGHRGLIQLSVFVGGFVMVQKHPNVGVLLLIIWLLWWLSDVTRIPNLLERYSEEYKKLFRITGGVRPPSQKNNDRRISGYIQGTMMLLFLLFFFVGESEQMTRNFLMVFIGFTITVFAYSVIIHIIEEHKRKTSLSNRDNDVKI